jgi:hypothetical protein
MSLKAFHIFFIALAIIVTFIFGTWLFITVEAGEAFARFVFGGLAYAAGLILILYARYFLRKFQHLSFM